MEITILCKVVDNYGDIGFVYRLAKDISELYPDIELRLVVSDLSSFAAMAPFVRTDLARQSVKGWQIFDWNCESLCSKEFSTRIPEIILQCFQCERPEWLDEILFAPEQKKTIRIVNLEYLTAETWADDFHLLKSGTRSIFVKKVNFMPGFTKKTGGLVLGRQFLQFTVSKEAAVEMLKDELETELFKDVHTFCVTVFAYKRNFRHLVRALKSFAEKRRKSDGLFKVHAFVASGLACEPFEEAWKKEGCPFAITKLPYLRQEAWDALLCASDFNFVRGEDSFARACLCGNPFVWHAYPQDEEVHLLKVGALLERIKAFVANAELFQTVKEYFLLYNKRFPEESGSGAKDEELTEEKEGLLLQKLLENYGGLKEAALAFSKELIANGNLTEHLVKYLVEYLGR